MKKPAPAAVEVREADPADGPALVAAIEAIDTETDFLGEPGDRMPWAERAEQQLRLLRENGSGVYFVAVAAGEIVGFLGAFPGWFACNRGVLFIAHVGLRARWRGRRIGTRLFEAVEAWAVTKGMHRLELRVDEENARGLALYRRRGFVEEGRMVGAYRGKDGWRNHLSMAKRLGDDLPIMAALEAAAPRLQRSLDDVAIRPIVPSDGAALQAFERQLYAGLKSIFLKSAAEVRDDPLQIEADIAGMLKRPSCRILAAFDGDGSMVAHGGVWPEAPRRMAHEAFCSIAVLPDWWGGGLDRRIMRELKADARTSGLRRLLPASRPTTRAAGASPKRPDSAQKS